MGGDKEILVELQRIRKLIVLQLVEQGVSPSQIGRALGITTAKDVRKLVPVKKARSKMDEGKI
jgi:hypothetical protein